MIGSESLRRSREGVAGGPVDVGRETDSVSHRYRDVLLDQDVERVSTLRGM
jgi:hypothetical protein